MGSPTFGQRLTNFLELKQYKTYWLVPEDVSLHLKGLGVVSELPKLDTATVLMFQTAFEIGTPFTWFLGVNVLPYFGTNVTD